MKCMVRCFSMVICMAVLFASVSLGAQDKFVFKGASVGSSMHPMGWAGKLFKEEMEKATDKVEIQWFPDSKLGGELQILNQLQSGTIQFATLSAAVTGTLNPKIMTMFSPYLIKDWDTFLNKWQNSEGARLVLEGLKKQGIIGLGWIPYGFDAIVNIDPPIRSLEEAKGRKMRTAEAPLLKNTLEAFGLNAIPLPIPDVYQGLQQKLVEGLAVPPGTVMAFRWDEVCKNVTLSNHIFGVHIFWVNEKALNRLPKGLREKFVKSVETACTRNYKSAKSFDGEALEKMKANGIKIWNLSESERNRWVRACNKVVIEHEKRIDKASKDGRQFMRVMYKSVGRDYDKEVYGQ